MIAAFRVQVGYMRSRGRKYLKGKTHVLGKVIGSH